MTSEEFSAQLRGRASLAGLAVVDAELALLEKYFRLLAKWNARINLTALPLETPTDETFDRLFIEPLIAAPFAIGAAGDWFDLGSGGGSPALPLKIACPDLPLTMVESRSRKAAFLREAAHALKLQGVAVVSERFEQLPQNRTAGLVTVRAVRSDERLFAVAAGLLGPDGRLIVFHSAPDELRPSRFTRLHVGASFVVFHVEQ